MFIKTNISTIIEEVEIKEDPITPNNTLSNTENQSPKTKSINIETFTESESPLGVTNSSIDSIVENIEKFTKKDNNTDSMSSFLELFNTGSLTDTEELEFTNLTNDESMDKLLKKIITNAVINNKNIYGTSGEESPTQSLVNQETLKKTPQVEGYKDKEYNSDLENEMNYFSEDEGRKRNQKKKRKFPNQLAFLRFFKRSKSN